MIEASGFYIDRLSPRQINILNDLFNFRIQRITWDFDQTMVDTETPVKQRFYASTGIDYRDMPIDRWLALSTRADRDNLMRFSEASVVENEAWRNPYALARVKPIRAAQLYSKIAYLRGVKQSIVTAREPNLKEVTLNTIRLNFNWFDEKAVHIRADTSVTGDEFKGSKVGQLASIVHFDDSLTSTKSVLANSNSTVIFFSRKSDRGQFTGNDRVIELPDMSMLLSSVSDFH